MPEAPDKGCFVNETQGSVSGLITHVRGDLDFSAVWMVEFICARHWVVLCTLSEYPAEGPCHTFGTPGSNVTVAASCAGLQLRDRTEWVAEGQH